MDSLSPPGPGDDGVSDGEAEDAGRGPKEVSKSTNKKLTSKFRGKRLFIFFSP